MHLVSFSRITVTFSMHSSNSWNEYAESYLLIGFATQRQADPRSDSLRSDRVSYSGDIYTKMYNRTEGTSCDETSM